MQFSFFNKDDGLAQNLKTKLKSESFLSFNNVIDFVSYARGNTNTKMVGIVSEGILQFFGMSIDYLMLSYNLYIPIFTYAYAGDKIQFKVNYLHNSSQCESNISLEFIAEAKYVLQEILVNDMNISQHNYVFLENFIEEEIEHSLKLSIYSENIKGNIEGISNIFASLSKLQIKLLKCFYRHKCEPNIKEIQTEVWGEDCDNKLQNLYTLISTTRNALKKVSGDKYQILKTQHGYKLIICD